MEKPAGESVDGPLRLDFNRRLKLLRQSSGNRRGMSR